MAVRIILVVLAISSWGCGKQTPLIAQPDPVGLSKVAFLGMSEPSSAARSLSLTVSVVRDGGPVTGIAVGFARSVSGRVSTFQWTGTTGENGRTQVVIDADSERGNAHVGGYYLARAIDSATGAVIGRWGSVPLNAGESRLLVLTLGGAIDFVPLPPAGSDSGLRVPPPDFPAQNPDCRSCDLRGADLRDSRLVQSDLYGSDMSGADFRGSDMYEVDLRTAILTEANLFETFVEGARMNGARLHRTNFAGADLNRADLREADLSGADLRGANLRSANLREANLTDANLAGADIEGAYLVGAIWVDGTRCGAGSIGQCNR